MNESAQRSEFTGSSREEIHSALFAQMILQLSNMAMMMMGKVPDPRNGQTLRDLETAQLFIDQLEALEAKTKGNLTREESALLKQTLMSLRLAFVEAVESPTPAGKAAEPGPAPVAKKTAPADLEPKPAPQQSPDPTEESAGKRFSKKYSS